MQFNGITDLGAGDPYHWQSLPPKKRPRVINPALAQPVMLPYPEHLPCPNPPHLQIKATADTLYNELLLASRGCTTSFIGASFSLVLLLNLLDQYPAITLDERPLRQLSAWYLVQQAPNQVRSFFELDPHLSAKLARLSLKGQQIMGAQFSSYARNWSSGSAAALKTALDMAGKSSRHSPIKMARLRTVPQRLRPIVMQLWEKHNEALADSILYLCAQSPHNKWIGDCLHSFYNSANGSEDQERALKEALNFIHISGLDITGGSVLMGIDWVALKCLWQRDPALTTLLISTDFSQEDQLNIAAKRKLLEVAGWDLECARELIGCTIENPMAFRCNSQAFIHSMGAADLLQMKQAVIWMRKRDTKEISVHQALRRLHRLTSLLTINPPLAEQLLMFPAGDLALAEAFLDKQIDYKKITLEELRAFLQDHGREELLSGAPGGCTPPPGPTLDAFLTENAGIEAHLDRWVSKITLLYTGNMPSDLSLKQRIDDLPAAYQTAINHIITLPENATGLLKFASGVTYLHPIYNMLNCLTTSPAIGQKILCCCLTRPQTAPYILSLYKAEDSHAAAVELLDKMPVIDSTLVERLLKIKNLRPQLFADVVGWMPLSSTLVANWISLAEMDVILPISSMPPAFIARLLADSQLLESCRYIDFEPLRDVFWQSYARDEKLTCKICRMCAAYPKSLQEFLRQTGRSGPMNMTPRLPILPSLLKLNEDDTRQAGIIDSFLFLFEGSASDRSHDDIVLLIHLSNLIDEGELDLLDRLLDMAKTTDAADVQLLLDRRVQNRGRHDPLLKLCLNVAGSVNSAAIGLVLRLDPVKHARIAQLLSRNLCGDQDLKIAAHLLSRESESYVQYVLDILEAPFSDQNQSLLEALYNGDFAFVEFLVENQRPEWSCHPSCLQEGLWNLESCLGPTHRAVSFGAELLKANVNKEAISAYISMVLFLNANDPDALNVAFDNQEHAEILAATKTAFATAATRLLSTKRQRSGSADADLSEIQKEDDFSAGLAACLICTNGMINKGLIVQLRQLPIFLNTFPEKSAYIIRLNIVLNWLEEDSKNINMLIARLRMPMKRPSRSYNILANMAREGTTVTDRTAREAVLCALFTNLRQHPHRGSCFGTSTAIASQSTYAGLVRTAIDYCGLVQQGRVTIRNPRNPHDCHTATPNDDEISDCDGNPLVRVREYIIAQMAYTSHLSMASHINALFGPPSDEYAVFTRSLFDICCKNAHPRDIDTFTNEIRTGLQSSIDIVYLPYHNIAGSSKQGAWGIKRKDSGKLVTTPAEFVDLIKSVVQHTGSRLCIEQPLRQNAIAATFNAFSDTIDKEGLSLLEEALALHPKNTHIQNTMANYKFLPHTPWLKLMGGDGGVVQANYYKEMDAYLSIKKCPTPEIFFYNLLVLVKALPQQVQELVDNGTEPLLGVTVPEHVCNLDIARLLAAAEGAGPATVIESLKKEVYRLRALPVSEPFRDQLISALSRDGQGNEQPLFLNALKQQEASPTIGDLLDATVSSLTQIAGSAKYANLLYPQWEYTTRQTLAQNGYLPPPVIMAIDLNYRGPDHSNLGIGFGVSILTGKVIEFETHSHGQAAIPVHASTGYCKSAWFISHRVYS